MAASMFLSACQTAAPSQYGAGDASQDVCAAEHRDLANSQNYFAEEVVKGAVTGAILGGLTGALLSGGRGSAIAAGAASGAVAGGSMAYWQARQKDNADRFALARSIHGDLVRELGEIDRVSTTFAKVRACRTHHAAVIKADFRAGRLSREDAKSRLHALWLQYQSDIQVAESISGKMAERADGYRTASNELTKMEGGTPQATTTAQAPTNTATASKSTKTTTKTTTTKTTTAKTVDPAATPQTAQGVAELTSSNQVKQAGFSKQVQEAKSDQAEFDLSGSASLMGTTIHAYIGGLRLMSLAVG
jgi:predicted ribosomally synthesized peptide with SipW-like signal peptide